MWWRLLFVRLMALLFVPLFIAGLIWKASDRNVKPKENPDALAAKKEVEKIGNPSKTLT